ncbi:ATP-binding protein [Limibacillus halophilus]
MPDVETFLGGLGLEGYAPAFAENAIDAETLLELTDQDLKDLGVAALGHRKKILRALAELRGDGDGAREAGEPAPQGHGQKRQLTLVFADLVESTELSQRLGLEGYRKTLRAYQDWAKEAIEAEGGYVAKYLGDGVLAYFGYPRANEDDPLRAVQAALSLIRKVAAAEPPLALRVGVETGPVVVGDILGEAASREHTVVGETPNLAARLQALAKPGGLVIGPRCHRLIGRRVQAQALGPQRLKGFSEPVEAWTVTGLKQAHEETGWAGESGQPPLIGRRRELGALAAAFSRMQLGEPAAVQITGEAGIGKSRLVSEFLRQVGGGAKLLTGHCAAQGSSTAFYPFLDLLRREYLGSGGADAGAVAQRLLRDGLDEQTHLPYLLRLLDLEHPARALVQPDLVGRRTEEALSRLLLGQGRTGPSILFINDLHWIDERSQALLHGLLRDPARRGLLLIMTARRRFAAPWSDEESVERLELEPLSQEEGLQLLNAQLAEGETAEEASLREIVERAGGNPLFLEALGEHLGERRAKRAAEEIGVPETLAGLLMQRVDNLSPRARSLAALAAVAGRRFEGGLILTPEDDQEALAELERARVVHRDAQTPGAYRFHHALLQDAVYASLLREDRERLHRLLGERLLENHQGREAEVAEDLARHFQEGGDPQRAARYAHLAGQKALELFALKDAETWFSRCIELLPEETDREADLIRASSIVNLSQVRCWNVDFPGMVSLARSNLPAIRALGEIEEVSYALTWIGEGYMHAGRLAEARETLESAAAIAEGLSARKAEGYAKGELLWLDSICGPVEAPEAFEARCEALRVMGEELQENYLALLSLYPKWAAATQRGEIGKARRLALEMIAFGEESAYPPAACWGPCLLADSDARIGNLEEALASCEAARAAAACPFDDMMAELSLGMTLAAAGRRGEGLAILSKAPWRSDRIGALFFAYAGDAAYGRALAEEGRSDEALKWLKDGIAYFEESGNGRAVCLLRLELLRALLAVEGGATPAEVGFWARLRGREKKESESLETLSLALETGARDLDMRGVLAEALLLRARHARAQGDREASKRALEEAAGIAASLDWLRLEQAMNAEWRSL